MNGCEEVSFLYITGFNLLIFCGAFCVYMHEGHWSIVFFFMISLFGFAVMVLQ